MLSVVLKRVGTRDQHFCKLNRTHGHAVGPRSPVQNHVIIGGVDIVLLAGSCPS